MDSGRQASNSISFPFGSISGGQIVEKQHISNKSDIGNKKYSLQAMIPQNKQTQPKIKKPLTDTVRSTQKKQMQESQNNFYIVKKIHSKKIMKDNQVKYLIEWEGYPNRQSFTWQPIQSIQHLEMEINNFESQYNSRLKKQKVKIIKKMMKDNDPKLQKQKLLKFKAKFDDIVNENKKIIQMNQKMEQSNQNKNNQVCAKQFPKNQQKNTTVPIVNSSEKKDSFINKTKQKTKYIEKKQEIGKITQKIIQQNKIKVQEKQLRQNIIKEIKPKYDIVVKQSTSHNKCKEKESSAINQQKELQRHSQKKSYPLQIKHRQTLKLNNSQRVTLRINQLSTKFLEKKDKEYYRWWLSGEQRLQITVPKR